MENECRWKLIPSTFFLPLKKKKVGRWKWLSNALPSSLVNQILGKLGSSTILHLHLISFNPHLFNNPLLEPILKWILVIQFHTNKLALRNFTCVLIAVVYFGLYCQIYTLFGCCREPPETFMFSQNYPIHFLLMTVLSMLFFSRWIKGGLFPAKTWESYLSFFFNFTSVEMPASFLPFFPLKMRIGSFPQKAKWKPLINFSEAPQ